MLHTGFSYVKQESSSITKKKASADIKKKD